jgi:hypothetical protein
MSKYKFVKKCKECGKDTLLAECIQCLNSDTIRAPIKKSNNNIIKSIMDIHKLKVIKYSKNPSFIDLGNNKPKNKRYTWNTTKEIIDDKFLKKSNWGIICNKKSGVMGVDLDTHKWNKEKEHLFYKEFGKDFIKLFNTYTQKTPNGGFHLVFIYDKDLNQTESKLNSNFGQGIDIRNGHDEKINSGGYLLGAGSVFKKKDGTIVKYEIVNNAKPAIINEKLKKWLLKNIYDIKEKVNKENKDFKQKFNIETEFINNTYSYDMSAQDFENNILKNIDKKYLNEFSYWLKLTSAMKQLNLKELWHKYSSKSDKYNIENNNQIWHNIDLTGNNYYIEYILKNCYNPIKGINPIADAFMNCVRQAKTTALLKYKPIEKDKKKPNEIIHRAKLSKCKNDKQESEQDDPPINLNLNTLSNGIILKSDTGTGKTTLLKEALFKNEQKFISIVSRVSLGKEQYQIFNEFGIDCKFYANCWPEKGDSIITTIDSLLGCGTLLKDIGNYTVFIDEFNSVLEYIMQADTCLNKIRAKLWKYLIYILKNCKNFICVDADISDMCFSFLDNLQLTYNYIKNSYKHNKGIISKEFFDLDLFIEEINKKDKYIVCCDSKRAAEYIYLETGSKAKLLTSATEKLTNETLDDYDQIIFSPCIIYGLDSSMRRPVFAYHKESTISPKNMLQQISRCRDIEQLNYCFQKQTFQPNKYDTITDAIGYVTMLKDITAPEFDILDNEAIKQQEIFNKVYAEYIYKQDTFNTNKYIHFKLLLKERGFIVKDSITKTAPLNNVKIDNQLITWKKENLNIENAKIQDFNNKYLQLTKTQLLSIKDLFLKEEFEINNMFSLKKYFEYGFKNKPLFNNEKEYNNIKEQDWAKNINKEQLANFYDYDATYNTLKHQEEIKTKKIKTSKFKFYLIDKLKVLCNYKGTEQKGLYNTIEARTMPKKEDIDKFLKFYKVAFNYRGKKDPIIKNKNDCEKFLYDMLKKTFGDIYKKKKIRIDTENTKTLYFLNNEFDMLIYTKKISNYQRINKFNEEIKGHLKEKVFKTELKDWLEDKSNNKEPYMLCN